MLMSTSPMLCFDVGNIKTEVHTCTARNSILLCYHLHLRFEPTSGTQSTLSRWRVITASSIGIGLAIAKALLPLYHVVISSRSSSYVGCTLSTLHPAPDGVSGLVCHVSNEAHRQKLLEQAKKRREIKELILNAAVSNNFRSDFENKRSTMG